MEDFLKDFYKEEGGKYTYTHEGAMNIKVSTLEDHTKIVEYRKL